MVFLLKKTFILPCAIAANFSKAVSYHSFLPFFEMSRFIPNNSWLHKPQRV